MARKENSSWISTDLILANTSYADCETVLIMSGESIDLIEAVAGVAKEVHVYDTSWSKLQQLRRFVKAQNVIFSESVYPLANPQFDTALLFVPKGRDFARAQLWTTMQALKDGGELYLCGPKKGGAKTMIKDATVLFGECRVLDYKKSHRVAVSKKRNNVPFPSEWGTAPDMMQQRTYETPLGNLTVRSLPGIFSWDELDEGTAYLLEHLDLRDAKTLLDMACGNGIIGVLAAQSVERVTMVDDNLLAVYAALETIESNGLDNCIVQPGNGYDELADTKFDIIVSNPPFHHKFSQDTGVAERIIREAPQHLVSGGRLVLVCNAFLKYDQLMDDCFKQTRIIAQNAKFKVLEGVNR